VVGGTIYVLDSIFTNTFAAVVINAPKGPTTQGIVLNGGTTSISSWVIGTVYDTANPNGAWFGGKPLDAPHPATASLRGGPQGGYFERQKPSYSSSTHDYWLIAQALAKG
jgi:glucan 1,3-beta-glucosidase